MIFNKKNYIELLEKIKPHLVGFETPGDGIVLRHDVDERLDRAFDMARLEFECGIRSTYFILDTASYWKYCDADMYKTILLIQNAYGHEVGWHNNAITVYYRSHQPIREVIELPLYALRRAGLTIRGTASHGDPMCHERNYINYNVFGFKANPWDGYNGETFKLEDFGLTYEAYHNGQTGYISDSHGRWTDDNDVKLWLFFEQGGRIQLLIHPEWWDLT